MLTHLPSLQSWTSCNPHNLPHLSQRFHPRSPLVMRGLRASSFKCVLQMDKKRQETVQEPSRRIMSKNQCILGFCSPANQCVNVRVPYPMPLLKALKSSLFASYLSMPSGCCSWDLPLLASSCWVQLLTATWCSAKCTRDWMPWEQMSSCEDLGTWFFRLGTFILSFAIIFIIILQYFFNVWTCYKHYKYTYVHRIHIYIEYMHRNHT